MESRLKHLSKGDASTQDYTMMSNQVQSMIKSKYKQDSGSLCQGSYGQIVLPTSGSKPKGPLGLKQRAKVDYMSRLRADSSFDPTPSNLQTIISRFSSSESEI